MNHLFSPDIYKNRREKLQQSMSSGVLLFLGNNEVPMNYASNTYHFRQDSTFLYFFGLQIAHLAAVIDVDNDKTILFGDDFEIDDIIWMGQQPTVADLAARVGVSETRPMSQLAAFLKSRDVHYIAPYHGDLKIELSELTGIAVGELRARQSVALIKAIVALRSIKEPCEVAEIERACEVGVKMHTAVMRGCVAGATERSLAGLAEGISFSYGSGPSFPIILSQHGETLHNHNHDGILQAGSMLLMDAGAESLQNYCSDYTRTIPVGGSFTAQQADIYNIVLKANLEGIAASRPGVYYKEVHRRACEIIAEGLTALGLMKGNAQEAVEVGAHALFLPHGLGHQLGLDVHDMENYGEDFVGYDETIQRSPIFGWASLRMARALQPGHVITVEPGIYFIPELIDIWKNEGKFCDFINYDEVEKYRHFGGIRIEDDVLISGDGARVLGPHLPKSIKELKNIVGK